jgi:ATP-binding cassette subfamily C protein CydCD
LFLLLLAPEFYLPLRMLGLRFHAGMSGTTAAHRIFEILDMPVSGTGHQSSPLDPLSPILISPNPLLPFSQITFENLSYTYPGETEPTLKDLTLEIHAGEHIALVGSSGVGKSTLAALLLRFIEPGSGRLTINNEPSTVIPLEAWRRGFAWVPQNPYLFHDTIAANLRLARPDATNNELNAAARLAHLDQFIQELPDKYETMIGEQGARLSAGQAQRLALARAFLKDAPILILDEPTSNLDPQQEALVESSVRELMRDRTACGAQPRTIIIIAHRLNTVFQADKIVVLEGGRIVETGTHTELLAKGGVYAQLVGASEKIVALTTKSPSHAINKDLEPLSLGSSDPIAPDLTTLSLPSSISHSLSPIPRPLSLVPRLLSFLRGSWGWVALSVLLGVLTVGSNVGLMGTSGFLISAAALHPELGTLQVAIVGVRFFGIARGVFRYAERLTAHDVTFRLLARLRTWFYQALEPLAPARLMQYRSGDLLGRIVTDVETLENFYVRVVSPTLVAVLSAVGMTIFFGHYASRLAWTYFAFMLLLGLGVPLLASSLSSHPGAELVSQRAGLQARLVDGIQGLADLLAFGRGSDYAQRLLEDGKHYSSIQRNLAALSGLSAALTILLVNLGMLAVLTLAIPLVGMGQIPGVLLAVLTLAASAGFEAVMPLPLAAQTLSSNRQAARRLFEIVDAKPVVADTGISGFASLSLTSPVPFSPALSFSNLSFAYPSQSEPALQNITFQLNTGRHLAIVGPSGAGKSTLANLLLRFWDYTQGQIQLDGRDLHAYPQEQVRRLFSFISQRAYFFNDTVRQNLLLARPGASEPEIQNAAQQAQIHNFIVGLPQGYETFIGERGYRLSGGERQRLALARVILQDAPIFLLDEPTANLDPLTEHRILETLFALVHHRSLLLITHRLVRLQNMDEIIVLDHGRIVDRGSHAELVAMDSLYRRMWDMQNRMLEEE